MDIFMTGYVTAVQIALLSAVVIYFLATFFEASHSRRIDRAEALPCAAWLVLFPIMLVSIAEIGNFAHSFESSIPTPIAGPIPIFVKLLIFSMFLLSVSVFIVGFARCIYTVNLLDQNKWWNVQDFRSRFITGRSQYFEFFARLGIAASFAVHQGTILAFVSAFSGEVGSPTSSFVQSLSRSIGTWVSYAKLPYESTPGPAIQNAAVNYFVISGCAVFLSILAWTYFVKRSFSENISAITNDAEKIVILRQISSQQQTGLFGIFTTLGFVLVFNFRSDIWFISLTAVLVVYLTITKMLVFLFRNVVDAAISLFKRPVGLLGVNASEPYPVDTVK